MQIIVVSLTLNKKPFILLIPAKKNPRTDLYRSRDVPFLSLKSNGKPSVRESSTEYIQEGLLTYGSSYLPRLPIYLMVKSGMMRHSSPITAAGPSPNLTEFPFKLVKST